ncbi:hypothetical protein [Nocardioides sp. zg-1228]|uniref:hypothetical protein n=1 Tax=Nocardioides sp. zg-1228 TaxID=2763008 RepID=UPI001642A5D6|nr:hypothetical protein [Nocardioides sp. zg-1228]MBC2934691.1 hypothetical protein [Nocardioides sp. zg-1228]QSF56009.1 hypothetical protein JX575_09910 [Nocardioides sp. zg-1228]
MRTEPAGLNPVSPTTSTGLGVALGIAALGSIGAAFFSSERAGDQYADAGVSAPPETLAAAVDMGRDLPAGAGSELVATATSAFMDGFGAAAWVSAVVMAAVAAMAAVSLRKVESPIAAQSD